MTHIIFLHGFFSSPQSRKVQHFLNEFPESKIGAKISGYHVLDLYPTIKDFEYMTITSLVEKIQDKILEIDDHCIIVGSSHGGLLALAAQQVLSEKLLGMVLLAPAIRYYKILDDRYDLDTWIDRGHVSLNFPRFDVEVFLQSDYIEDLKQYQQWQDPDIPVLLIHGRKDEVVPISHSKAYASRMETCTEFYPAEGIHNLSNVIDQITAIIIEWIDQKFD